MGEPSLGEDFAAWCQAEAPRLTRALTALADGDHGSAQDATQEACARALARWRRVQAMDNPTGWVYRTALRELRRTQRRSARIGGLPPLHEPSCAATDAAHPVWTAVADLPDRMRQAVALRYIADLPEHVIADAMDLTRGGVSSLLAKARTRLERALAEELDHD